MAEKLRNEFLYKHRITNTAILNNPIYKRYLPDETVILKLLSSYGYEWEVGSLVLSSDFLEAFDGIMNLIEDLKNLGNEEVTNRVDLLIQMVMSKLEDEFRHILTISTVPFDADRLDVSVGRVSPPLSPSSGNEGDIPDAFGTFYISDSSPQHEMGTSAGGDISLERINPEFICDLREIANCMIRAGYDKECCQVYTSVRRDVLDECLRKLDVKKLSIEEVPRTEWSTLDGMMKNWAYAVKVLVRFLLNGEKTLCEKIFHGPAFELAKNVCFLETTKGCVMEMLNFGEAIAICKRSPEKIHRVLGMYEAFSAVFPQLQTLFSELSGGSVCREAKGVLDALGETAKGTFSEFEKELKEESSRKVIKTGDIHPLTRYAMNLLKLLVEYRDTMNALSASNQLGVQNRADGADNVNETTPFDRGLLGILNSLDSKLDEKADLYKDSALRWVFLMNNKHYMMKKVKDADHPQLWNVLGDDWLNGRLSLVNNYAANYLRASWSKALACFSDAGIEGSPSNAAKVVLKERFKKFNVCFEEIYKTQTAWNIPDEKLRTDLDISISEQLLSAYRAFLARFEYRLMGEKHVEKYIKYRAEDLEKYLGHLFQGKPAVLRHKADRF